MKTTKILTILRLRSGWRAILVLALVVMVCSAKVSKAVDMGTVFTYQGRLIDANSVADGLYDFQFKLFDDVNVVDGNQVSGDVNVPETDVIDGYFTVELDFGSAFDGDARWLEIGVRDYDPCDVNAFTVLTPRQEVTPTPYAIYAKSDGDWMVSGNNMYSIPSGNVGIGTTSPEFKLTLDNDGGIIAKGTYESGDNLTVSGAGTRLIWYPKKAAFRAGTVDSSQWDDPNIGLVSVAMGQDNTASNEGSTVSGGSGNTASSDYATVGGGYRNTASGYDATVGGGYLNEANGFDVTIGGGFRNDANGVYSTIGGGILNKASNQGATVSGGCRNEAAGFNATISGGGNQHFKLRGNIASGDFATISGGCRSAAIGDYATVPGGQDNNAVGDYSFASGRRAKANHDGVFIWADSTDANFTSTANDQFLIRASGGVGIGTTNPGTARLAVMGGNVGIGTTGPSVPLEVVATTTNTVIKCKRSDQSGQLNIAQDSHDNWGLGAGSFGILVNDANQHIGIRAKGSGHAQLVLRTSGRVGIGTTSPQGALDVESTTGAFIVPRMTTAQRNALTAVNGMIIYNTSTNQFNFRENGAWVTK